MDFQALLIIAVGAIFLNNFVFSRVLGICPYVGVSAQLDSAIGMGMAVTFVLSMASMVAWVIHTYILAPTPVNLFYHLLALPKPPDLTFLKTIVFILVIATLVQFVEMVIQKTSPALYKSLGIYLPLITTNCAVLGVAILNVQEQHAFVESLLYGFGSALGFTLVLLLFTGLRERLALAQLSEAMAGAPIGFVTAGLLALAFMGFAGLA